MIRSFLTTVSLSALLWLAGPVGIGPTATNAQGCLSQKETQALVASGRVNPFSAYYGGLQQQGQVVSSCLTQRGGGYAYVVKLVKANGQVVSLTIGAN